MWTYKYTGQPEHKFNEMACDIILNHAKQNHRNFYYRTMELGAGTGQLSFLLKKASNHNQTAFCVDKSPSAIEYMNRYFKSKFKPFEFCLIQDDIFKLDMEKDFFDTVISSGLIEHFKNGKLKELCEIHKQLSNNFVVVIVPADNKKNNKFSDSNECKRKYGYQKPMDEKELDFLFIDDIFKKVHSERFYKDGKLLISIYQRKVLR